MNIKRVLLISGLCAMSVTARGDQDPQAGIRFKVGSWAWGDSLNDVVTKTIKEAYVADNGQIDALVNKLDGMDAALDRAAKGNFELSMYKESELTNILDAQKKNWENKLEVKRDILNGYLACLRGQPGDLTEESLKERAHRCQKLAYHASLFRLGNHKDEYYPEFEQESRMLTHANQIVKLERKAKQDLAHLAQEKVRVQKEFDNSLKVEEITKKHTELRVLASRDAEIKQAIENEISRHKNGIESELNPKVTTPKNDDLEACAQAGLPAPRA